MAARREPAVAGLFYPAEADALRAAVAECLEPPDAPGFERLAFVPHAGYRYSGRIAGAAYRRLRVPPLVVVLAPNHHGIGAPLALPRAGTWRTPLGDLEVDAAASEAITRAGGDEFSDDWVAHSRDHALEVQLPFVQARAEASAGEAGPPSSPALVTLAVGTYDRDRLLAAGSAVAAGLREVGATAAADVLLVVSSDMSHFIPAEQARRLDEPVLRLVERADAEGVHAEVTSRGLTVCGFAPAVVGLAAARELGVGTGRVVAYGHSGDVTGDDSDVVAYASVLLPAAA